MREIERKFLVDRLPAALPAPRRLRQAYVAIDDAAGVEVRVRLADGTARVTSKRGSGLERDEVEFEVDADVGAALYELAVDRSIEKDRYLVDLGDGVVAELDRYRGDLEGTCVVEVEFDDREAADRFVPPDWFGREVTGEAGWSNAELARRSE